MNPIRSLLTLCLSCLLVSSAWAQNVSEYIPYQGFLYDNTGAPLNSTVSLTFKLYATSNDVQSVWEETIQNVPVQNGSFSVVLGQVQTGVRNYFTNGQAHYMGIAINGQDVLPRQRLGSQPYAFLSYNALRFNGQSADSFATQADLANVAGLTEQQVTDLINTIVDARGYLNQAQIQDLIDAAIAGVNATVANLQGQVTTLQTQVGDLQTQVNNLQTQLTTEVTDLQNQIDALNNNNNNNNNTGSVEAEVLGVSNQASDGKFQFNGQNGVRAATEMCKASYANVATAHLCTHDEVARALSLGNYNNNIDGVTTWTVDYGDPNFLADPNNMKSCQGLLYDSGDVANGITITVNTDYTSGGGGGSATGAIFEIRTSACNVERRVLCCR